MNPKNSFWRAWCLFPTLSEGLVGLNGDSEGKERLQTPQALELVKAWHMGPRRAGLPSCHLALMLATPLPWQLG